MARTISGTVWYFGHNSAALMNETLEWVAWRKQKERRALSKTSCLLQTDIAFILSISSAASFELIPANAKHNYRKHVICIHDSSSLLSVNFKKSTFCSLQTDNRSTAICSRYYWPSCSTAAVSCKIRLFQQLIFREAIINNIALNENATSSQVQMLKSGGWRTVGKGHENADCRF